MRRTYGTVYTDIVRASSDAIDALSLYRRLLFTEGPGAETLVSRHSMLTSVTRAVSCELVCYLT